MSCALRTYIALFVAFSDELTAEKRTTFIDRVLIRLSLNQTCLAHKRRHYAVLMTFRSLAELEQVWNIFIFIRPCQSSQDAFFVIITYVDFLC